MTPAMTRRQALRAAAAAAILPATAAAADPSRNADVQADLVIHNGSVHTLDRHGRRAQALAIKDGQIAAVGDDRDMRRLIGRRTEVINAGGNTVMPGINDSHLHLTSYGLTFPPLSVDLDTETLDELIARVAAAAAQTPSGEWIRGRGWSELRLPRAPTRHDLDPVTGDRPTILVDFTLHTSTANSAAIRLAGITPETVPPAGGVIERDHDGQPSGVLREGAQQLLQRVVPPYSGADLVKAVKLASAALNARGITSVTEPGIDPRLAALYEQMAAAGDKTVRVTALLHAGASPTTMDETLAVLRGWRSHASRRWFRLAGVKIVADGVPTQARTAWMHTPYTDGMYGSLTIAGGNVAEQVANLNRMIGRAHRARVQIGTHACGDAAIDAVVAAYVAALRNRPNSHRHYLIHGDMVSPSTLARMARHGIDANFNAEIKYLIGRALAPLIGDRRTDYHWPYRTALQAGVRISSGSDAPVTDPQWLHGLTSMVLRTGNDNATSGPAQRIGLTDALRTYTSAPARQDHAEQWKGTLAPGLAADICLLDADLQSIEPGEYNGASATVVIAGGRVVYERNAFSSAVRPRPTTPGRYLSGGCCALSR
ncbi:amidohydrolase [Catellatospora chokoriensis]|uniref:Amidohydrolase n=2 Tax=Catellatospora chokoriensis TaxID=310353 RepID=A0A8J3JWM6_9ACTN|nr:amidohydrolase [Catellatospora chokoriensis]